MAYLLGFLSLAISPLNTPPCLSPFLAPQFVETRPDFLLVVLIFQPQIQFSPTHITAPVLRPLATGHYLHRYRRKALKSIAKPISTAPCSFCNRLTRQHRERFTRDYGG
jgi:hypothetical protein